MHWDSCNNAVHLLNKAKSQLFRSIMNFQAASMPAVRPGSARCMAAEIQHSNGNRVGFTKLLF